MTTALLEYADIKDLSEDAWRDQLLRSVDEPVQAGRLYPGFPDESTQRAWVGSASAEALNEAFHFYRYIQSHLRNRRFKVPAKGYLDFGCGWGRIGRFFLRDFEREDMVGVDVDPTMVAFCEAAKVPGRHFTIRNEDTLPFEDGAFRLVTAYSVFTHLPSALFKKWLDELLRVTARGGLIVFTVEPPRFLDFVAEIDPDTAPSGWHRALAEQLGDLGRRKAELQSQGFTYLPTNGGAYRPAETYGDMVVTRRFVEEAAAGSAEVLAYLDDASQFWQGMVVLRKHRWPSPLRWLAGRRFGP